MLSLDCNVVEYLRKGSNASELVNRLLLEHMKRENWESMTMEQLKAEKEVIKFKRECEAKCKEVRNNAIRK